MTTTAVHKRTTPARLDAVVEAARSRRDWEIKDDRDEAGNGFVRLSFEWHNEGVDLEVWYIDYLSGHLRVTEGWSGIAKSGRRAGREIDLSHKSSLRRLEERLEIFHEVTTAPTSTPVCPRCQQAKELVTPSRTDGVTLVCDLCRRGEGYEAQFGKLRAQSEWPVRSVYHPTPAEQKALNAEAAAHWARG
jgi:hypothetical protein